MTKSTRKNGDGKHRAVQDSHHASGLSPVSAPKLTDDVIRQLHETRERILHGRILKTNSTETLRRFRDGGIEGTTHLSETNVPAKR